MKTSENLKQILERIDHRGYPAYKDTRGVYQFGTYILGIDHVQGDPFAAPSRLHIQVAGRAVRIPKELYDSKHKKTAVADYLLRNFAKQLERHSFQAHGSGKSGIIQVTRCGQEVLERTACEIDEKTGDVTVRFEVGFPARGRTIQAGELVKILYQYLPACVEKALYYKNMDRNAVKQAAELSVDQEYIREQLKKEGLVAFVADESILPRESGVSQRPMKDAVPFASPDSMRITMKLPYKGMLTGMGIRKGVTLIVGGGLAGEDIPLSARIVAIADSYDAMNSKRIYRNALPPEKIFEEIQNNRGLQFDPDLADIFLELLFDDRVHICEHCEFSEDDPELPFIENEIENFVSNVMSTIQTQEDSESFDFLTGLPMRSRGEKLTAQFMQQYSGCLIFIDMDNLKKINDIHGHKAGDRALKVLGTLLAESSQNSAVCRLGGDEFLLFIPETDKEQVTAFIQDLFEKFEHAKSEDPEIQYASISAGLYLSTKGEPFEDCYSKADKALYHVKQNGKQGFFFYQQMELDFSEDEVTGKDLGLIAHALSESGRYNGALNLDYREFAKIYEYMNHLNERYKHHCFLIMVSIDTAPGSVTYTENREYALACMEQAIHEKIRKVDICTRYSSMQYLLILYEPDETQIPKVMDRIFQYFDTLYDKKDFIPSYEYRPILHSND